jgi:uncharacterized membrane protein YagU involved in acid resistance
MLDTDDHNSSRTTHLSVERMLEGLVGAAMMVATLLRRGLWAPVQLIAAAGLGAAAMMQVRAGGILVGLMTHMMRGVVLALIVVDAFQLLRPGFGPMRLLYGLIAGVVSQFVILPVIDPMMATHMAPWAFAVAHIMFGLVAAAFVLRRQPQV